MSQKKNTTTTESLLSTISKIHNDTNEPFELSDDSDDDYEATRQSLRFRQELQRQQYHHRMMTSQQGLEQSNQSPKITVTPQDVSFYQKEQRKRRRNHHYNITMKGCHKSSIIAILFLSLCIMFEIVKYMDRITYFQYKMTQQPATMTTNHGYWNGISKTSSSTVEDNNQATVVQNNAMWKNVADLYSIYDPGNDIPLFWHIPHSSTEAINIIMECTDIVTAWSMGIGSGHGQSNVRTYIHT